MVLGPTAIIDKSTLQALNSDEAGWFSHHFRPNLVSVLFIEIIGTLSTSDRTNPIGDVVSLAKKIRGFGTNIMPNIEHQELVIANLLGGEVEMKGVPVVGGAKLVKQADGKLAYFLDEPPEMKALWRWMEGRFTDDERKGASLLRKLINETDLRTWKAHYDDLKKDKLPKTFDQVMRVVNRILEAKGSRYSILKKSLDRLQVPLALRNRIIQRWKSTGQMALQQFAPYAHHKLRVDLFFDLALGSGLINATDSKNVIDSMYLYYLPFCRVFISSDKLHRDIVPSFLNTDQRFIWGPELKADLTRLVQHYRTLPPDTIAKGSMTYARLPPKEGDFLVAKIFDELFPDWRETQEEQQEMTEDERKTVLKNFEAIMKQIRP